MARTGKGRKVFHFMGRKVQKLRNARIARQNAGLDFSHWVAYTCTGMKKHAALVAGSVVMLAGTAYALPQGPAVVSGDVAISQPNASTMQINQGSNKAIINWQGYSIGAGEAVRYLQPGAGSIALNRVIGLDPSSIYGQLSANGQVWVINPNGLLIGPGAQINTAGFLGSTLNISDQNFLAGNYKFTAAPSSLASIINRGNISVSPNGYVALLSPSVTNEGTIVANAGKVFIGSGEEMTLNFEGNNLISLVVDKPMQDALGIKNTGSITAEGGTVVLTARTASDILKNVVNNEGIIEATSLVQREGKIILDGGDAGIVANAGTLNVSSAEAGAKGGEITVLGKYVGLVDNAKLDASGDAGGGTILIGGNFQGKGPEPNACRTYVGKDVEIKADALSSGDGGRVIVWSDDATRFYGNISAKGGLLAGDGGFAEVSGKKALAFNGKADLSAVNGRFGTLLLDPDNIYINGSGHGAGEDISDTTIATILQTADLKLSANSKLFTSDKVTSVHPESPDLNVSGTDL